MCQLNANYNKVIERIISVLYRINMNDRQPKAFGTDQLLYHSEIHFIDSIGGEDRINASQLSRKLDITNGAVTQMAHKLIQKGLIEKYRVEPNKKTIFFRLTSIGKTAYDAHNAFHKELNDKVVSYLKSLNQVELDSILGLVSIAEEHLPRL